MARHPAGTPPSYCLHKQSGQAVFNWPLGDKKYKTILLGRYGTPESHAEYERVLAEWRAAKGYLPPQKGNGHPPDLTVSELVLRFWGHAKEYYRLADGSPSRELEHYQLSLKPLLSLYGATPAVEFGPLALKAVRQRLIDTRRFLVRFADESGSRERWLPEHLCRPEEGLAEWSGEWLSAEILNTKPALSRKIINQRVDHIKRVFAWGVSEELVPPSVLNALRTVAGLRRGHKDTYDRQKVKPVPDAHVDATLPYLRPQVGAMVQLQRLTGARPTEVCLMRGRDIDRDGPVWWYRIDPNEIPREGPANLHKTAHHEGGDGTATVKILPIGPKAQAVLKPFLRDDADEYLFQPREARAEQYKERRKKRKTPLYPSHVRHQAAKKKAAPKRVPRLHYDRHSYAHAVARAARKAGVPHWHPHQLKHSILTEVRRRHGVESARIYAGHKTLKVTEIYAEADLGEVERIALELG
jgi:integrase